MSKQNYDFTDLVLLIGTNPLPNFVVADRLLQVNPSCKTIWLVYSEDFKENKQHGTEKQKDAVKRLIQKRYSNLEFREISISNVSRAKNIIEEIGKELNRESRPGSLIHLNYTGGTKAMGTHAYRCLEKLWEENTNRLSFSYLDGRNFAIVDDDDERKYSELRDKVKLNLDDLIELHGFKRKNKDSDHDFSAHYEKYKQWIEASPSVDEFCKDYYSPQPLETEAAFTKAFSDQNNYLGANKYWKEVISSLSLQLYDTKKKKEHIYKFLVGGWLENYVYHLLYPDHPQNIWKDWQIRDDTKDEWEFQLDVILIRGYQLIGISCTVEDGEEEKKNLCKLKGFEIILRTRQIGGDEAKAILVTGMKGNKDSNNNLETLQKELELNTGCSDENILVLGREDWKPDIFLKKVGEFIQ